MSVASRTAYRAIRVIKRFPEGPDHRVVGGMYCIGISHNLEGRLNQVNISRAKLTGRRKIGTIMITHVQNQVLSQSRSVSDPNVHCCWVVGSVWIKICNTVVKDTVKGGHFLCVKVILPCRREMKWSPVISKVTFSLLNLVHSKQ